jgi:hypothetical protein
MIMTSHDGHTFERARRTKFTIANPLPSVKALGAGLPTPPKPPTEGLPYRFCWGR